MVALAVVIALCGVLLGVIVVGFVLLMGVAMAVDLVWAAFERIRNWPGGGDPNYPC